MLLNLLLFYKNFYTLYGQLITKTFIKKSNKYKMRFYWDNKMIIHHFLINSFNIKRNNRWEEFISFNDLLTCFLSTRRLPEYPYLGCPDLKFLKIFQGPNRLYYTFTSVLKSNLSFKYVLFSKYYYPLDIKPDNCRNIKFCFNIKLKPLLLSYRYFKKARALKKSKFKVLKTKNETYSFDTSSLKESI